MPQKKRYVPRLTTKAVRLDRPGYLAPEIYDAIRILAVDEGVSCTYILESALIDYFDLSVPY